MARDPPFAVHRSFHSYRADVVFFAPPPPAAVYAPPLSLNVIVWHGTPPPLCAMDIARCFDLNVCMFALKAGARLQLETSHPHTPAPDVRSSVMHMSRYAWADTWSHGAGPPRLMECGVRMQLNRLMKYYARGYRLQLEATMEDVEPSQKRRRLVV